MNLIFILFILIIVKWTIQSIIYSTTDYGLFFTSSIWRDNLYGVQFHPEKSSDTRFKNIKEFWRVKLNVNYSGYRY